MTPFNLPLTITKGLRYGPTIFQFKQLGGDPFSLVGWQVFAHARRNKVDKDKLDLQPVITDAAGGEVMIEFSDDDTSEMTPTTYGWDMLLQPPDGGMIGPYFAGALTIQELYTRV
jgi:hypothetical protein